MDRSTCAARWTLAVALLTAFARPSPAAPATAPSATGSSADVVVYGATPGGIAAAISAAKSGRSVVLVDPYRWVGGLTTNGLTHTDFRTFEGLTGFFAEFAKRVEAHYVKTFGPDSPQAKGNFRGTHAEPKVCRLVFEQMLAEQPKITVLLRHRITSGVIEKRDDGTHRLDSINVRGPDGADVTLEAKVYIDGTYEGDLMAAAQVPYRVGREGKAEYNESLAPDAADGQVQAYNFRLTMTREAANRVPPFAPPGYSRDDFVPLLKLLEDGTIKTVFCQWSGGIYKAQLPTLPNGKLDINDVSNAPVRLSMPGENLEWPRGGAAERQRVFDVHVRHDVGMFYFLQTDPAVPAKFRDEALQWGLCKDEYPDNGHLPEQLYVREARRMVGAYVYTQADVAPAGPDDARTVLRRDAIATGDYGNNCHGTGHEGPRIGGKHTGEFYGKPPPYQVPYGVIVPKTVRNLLVPVAASSSHVGFCSLRLEPIWCSLGQAAGHAADLALRADGDVRTVAVPALQAKLWADASATAYVSDVPPGHADFAAVQWWGTAGGFHGFARPPGMEFGQRGKNIVGQYFEAYPAHAAELDKPLDDATRARWLKLAADLKVSAEGLDKAATRGEFVRKAYAATIPR